MKEVKLKMRLEEVTKSKLRKATNSNLYVLRLRFLQLFAKYMGFEKKEPLLKVEWDIFFKGYKMLSNEFESRELKYNKREIDKRLLKTKKFFIKNLKGSLLVNIDNDSFLIDPLLEKKDFEGDIDYIIITQKNDECCELLKKYNLPVYSMGKIIDKLEVKEKHLLIKSLQITKNESMITPIKITKNLMGLKITKGSIEVCILPKLFPLTKIAGDLITKTNWIVKVNDYENDGVTGELSFVELMKLADELTPNKIYLVNLSKGLSDYKEKIDEALEKWSGRIIDDGEILNENSFEISKPEVTEKYVRIPVAECKITSTIDISTEKGIKALYCGDEKTIATYLFDVNKWDMVRAKAWVEENKTKKVDEKAEMFNCECISCGYKMSTVVHCKDIKCPKCGSQMRREERPGLGQQSKEEATTGSGNEKPIEPQQVEKKVKKSEEINFEFQKIDRKEHIVGGVVYHAGVEDAQGDGADADEIWKALKGFMLKKKTIKVMHKGISRNIPIIECFQVESDTYKGGQGSEHLLKSGDWWMSAYLGDKENKDIWEDVINKKLNGWSMAGRAQSV